MTEVKKFAGRKLGGFVSGPFSRIVFESTHEKREEFFFGVGNHYGGGAVGICNVDILDADSKWSVDAARERAQSIADAFDDGYFK